MTKKSISIDIGGTSTRIAVVNENGDIIERHQFSTLTMNPIKNLQKISEVIDGFNHEVVGIGMSCPGPLDLIKGVVLTPPNLPGWHGFALVEEAKQLFKLPVVLENDANLAAFAESLHGSGRNKKIVQYLTISTGIGSGLVIDGKIYIGNNGFAGEIANSILWKNGPSVGELKPGSIESISSGTGIKMQAKHQGLEVEHAGDLVELAINGNSKANQIYKDAQEYLANMIAIIIGVIDPSIIILGGGLALKIPGFIDEIEELVKQKVYKVQVDNVLITKSELGDDNGLIGGGLYALKMFGGETQ